MGGGGGGRGGSWTCTVVTQLCLCFGLYLAFNIGQPQQQFPSPRGRPGAVVFVTVRGGFRSVGAQTRLLKQIEDVARVYGAKFVVNISALGEEEDPLTSNSALQTAQHSLVQSVFFGYTTKASKGEMIASCFNDRVEEGHEGPTVSIVGLDTGSLQNDSLLANDRESMMNGSENVQNGLLGRTLEDHAAAAAAGNGSNWYIVIGYHPIIVGCDENHERFGSINRASETLHRMFVKHGVNAYLSTDGCSNRTTRRRIIRRRDGVDYIGVAAGQHEQDEQHSDEKELADDGFLLHSVTSLEMITYFISSAGKVLERAVTHQKGNPDI